ncbi:hypothetical protein ACFLYH_03720, partial [Candidatus Dependentiae bacterium]
MSSKIRYKFFILIFISLSFFNGICSKTLNILENNIFFSTALGLLDEVVFLQEQQPDVEVSQDLSDNVIDQSLLHKDEQESKGSKKDFIIFRDSLFFKKIELLLCEISQFNFSVKRTSNFKISLLFRKVEDQQKNIFTKNDILFFDKKNKDKINLIFELLRKGISYEFCLQQILFFRENLLNQLDELIKIINYWEVQYQNNSVVEEIMNSFSSPGKDVLLKRIRKLKFYQNRITAFLGKTDEICLFILNSSNCDQLSEYVLDSIFCINTFFEENSDPDALIFKERLLSFRELPLKKLSGFVCRNHLNLLLMGNCFYLYINGDKIPSFFNRHWLGISFLGVSSIGGGTYLYCNWDWLMGNNLDSPKNFCLNNCEKGKDWIINGFTDLRKVIKEKFGFDGENKESQKGIKKSEQALNDVVEKLKVIIDDFQELAEADYSIDPNLRGEDEGRDLKRDWKKNINEVKGKCGVASTLFDKFSKDINKSENSGLFEWLKNKSLYSTYGQGKDCLDDILKIVDTLFKLSRFGVKCGELGGIRCGELLTQFLTVIYVLLKEIVDKKFLTKIDSANRNIEVTSAWIKALIPALITTVLIPTIIYLCVNKKMRDRRNKRYNNIDEIISQIYRVLIGYKSSVVDYSNDDLKYKDQGLISYWIENLNKNIDTVSKDDKSKLFKLI